MEDLRGDLRATAAPELETNNTPKIMGAVLVVVAVGALSAYTLSSGMWNSPSPRQIASIEPAPVKITAPVAPKAPAIVPATATTPAAADQHAADTTATKAPTRIARVHKSDNAAPRTKDNSVPAPSPPADMMTPANAPSPATASPPATNPEPAAPAQPDVQP
jgi:hypothetical protein